MRSYFTRAWIATYATGGACWIAIAIISGKLALGLLCAGAWLVLIAVAMLTEDRR